MRNREEIYRSIKQLLTVKRDREVLQGYVIEMQKRHDISPSDVFNHICLKEDIETLGEEYLFALVEAVAPALLETGWNKNEIKKLRKWKKSKLSVPNEIRNMSVVVPGEQWIGVMQISELMKFGDAQMLRYNENTQRPLQFVHHGKIEYLRPYVNRRSEADITKLLSEGNFIPNTLTLQANEEAVLEYDEDEHILSLKSIDHFDILDGYHRYRAIINCHNSNPDWDYPMEIRIVQFTEDKAKKFIYQENHQNKMKHTAAEALNPAAPQNQVVKRLNEDSGCYLYDLIKRNGGIVGADDLGTVIGKCYFPSQGVTTNATALRSLVIKTASDIKQKLNDICELDENLTKEKWDYKFTFTVIYCIHEGKFSGKKLYNRIKNIYKQVCDQEIFKQNRITSIDTKLINGILGKEV